MNLADLLLDFNRIFPALNVAIAPCSGSLQHEKAELHALYSRLQIAHPHADPIYFAARTWQLWLWQPVYLAVWAAARGVAMDLQGACHFTHATFTDQFRLPERDLSHFDHTENAIVAAWHNIQNWVAEQFALCASDWQISEKLANYFVYDGILKALAAAHRFGLQNQHATEIAPKMWQNAIATRCFGSLQWQQDDNFQVNLLSCCQHYRRDEHADFCEGCPKRRNKQCDCTAKSVWCPLNAA